MTIFSTPALSDHHFGEFEHFYILNNSVCGYFWELKNCINEKYIPDIMYAEYQVSKLLSCKIIYILVIS